MIAWAIYVSVVCTSPRLDYREFSRRINPPDVTGEPLDVVIRRRLDTVEAFVEYAEAYREKCK